MTVPTISTYDAQRSRIEVRADEELVAWVDLMRRRHELYADSRELEPLDAALIARAG